MRRPLNFYLILIPLLTYSIVAGAEQKTLTTPSEMQRLGQHYASIRQQVDRLIQQTRQQTSALPALQQVANDEALTPLQRDAVIHGYAMALRQLRPDQVDSQTLRWLSAYTPQRWRLHEESASYRVPVFAVDAAVAGTRNEWSFEQGRDAVRLAADSHQTRQQLNRYRSADASYRQGFETAMGELPAAALAQWRQSISDDRAAGHSRLGGLIQLYQHDWNGLNEWLQQAATPTATPVLRLALQRLSTDPNSEPLLAFTNSALEHLNAELRGVVLAEVGETFRSHPEPPAAWQTLLRQQLADPATGSAAALQLAAIVDEQTLIAWRDANRDPLIESRLQLIGHLRQQQATIAGGAQ
ncbi:MAG: hypothetical protein Tsb002_20620 [Wenzhouxiangellaceae bacterium]